MRGSRYLTRHCDLETDTVRAKPGALRAKFTLAGREVTNFTSFPKISAYVN
jgi:hypothetical protein